MQPNPPCFECGGKAITSFHPWVESLVHYLSIQSIVPIGGSNTDPLASPQDFFDPCPYCTNDSDRSSYTAIYIIGL